LAHLGGGDTIFFVNLLDLRRLAPRIPVDGLCGVVANDNLRHAENHLLLLGRKNSIERVAAFLLEMDERITAARFVSLPMSRRDIADYLGVTLETVSRAISQLHRSGVLDFPSNNQKELVILDRQQLASFDLQG